MITNSQLNLSVAAVKKEPAVDDPQIIRDNKVVGFIFSMDGRRLKYYPIRLFKGEDFLDVTCTDGIGKFAFEGLRNGEYRLSTEDKNLSVKVRS